MAGITYKPAGYATLTFLKEVLPRWQPVPETPEMYCSTRNSL